MTILVSYKNTPIGGIALEQAGFSVKDVTVASHKKILKELLTHVYAHGLQEKDAPTSKTTHLLKPDSPRFFLLLGVRLGAIGYALE